MHTARNNRVASRILRNIAQQMQQFPEQLVCLSPYLILDITRDANPLYLQWMLTTFIWNTHIADYTPSLSDLYHSSQFLLLPTLLRL